MRGTKLAASKTLAIKAGAPILFLRRIDNRSGSDRFSVAGFQQYTYLVRQTRAAPPTPLDQNALREAFYAGEKFRGRGDARFLGGLEGSRDGALEGLRPQCGLEHDGVWLLK